jgi:glucose-1-phosphate cytidylyltransferase
MKVVLFCGGMGMRIRDYSDSIPKPMVPIGYRPILWNVMRYYAHYGHKDFILCLGHKADVIKNYFMNYNEYLSNDFTLMNGGKDLRLYNRDIDDWSITFVDTGLSANIGQRLKAVQKHLAGEEMFLANYSDGLTNLHLPTMINAFVKGGMAGTFLSVRPNQSYHIVSSEGSGRVTGINGISRTDIWINGGFFVLRNEVFDYMRPGEELVIEPFARLIEARKLHTYRHDGFWMSMDTLKDKQLFDDMYARGETPWEVWRENG